MPRARARRPSERSTAANRPRPSFRPGPEALEGRIAPAHNITIAVGGLATIPEGATTNADTGDYTISPDALAAVADVESLDLRANNDIRVNAPIVMRDGVGLALLAGRNVVVTGDGTLDTIRTINASISLIANSLPSGDVTPPNRDPGDGSLTLNDAIVAALGSGEVSLRGANGPDGPVLLLGRTTVRGESSLFGIGNTNTRPGIFIADTASVVDDAGRGIELSGFSAISSAGFSTGITLLGQVRSNGGTIRIDGSSQGSGPSGHGLLVSGPSARIEATGSGRIALVGKGGTGPGSFGVSLDGGGGDTPVPMVVAQDGPITINAGGRALATNFGVAIGERAEVRGNTSLSIETSSLSLNPVATPGSIFVAGGNVTLRVSSLRLDDPGTITTSNGLNSTVVIVPVSDTQPIVLGGPQSSNALVLNNSTFAAFSGFKTIAVESARAGDITMNGDVGPVNADLQIQSLGTAAGFVLSKTLDVGVNELILTANGAITQAPGGLIKGIGGALTVTAASVGTAAAPLLTQVSELGGTAFRGSLFLNNTGSLRVGPPRTGQLLTNGGDLVLKNAGPIQISSTPLRTAGGAIRINADVVANALDSAILLTGNAIDAQGGDVQLVANSTLSPAVALEAGGTVQTSGAGRITIVGKSTFSNGVRISGGSSVRSADGAIAITGETTTTRTDSASPSGIEIDEATIEATGRGGIALNGLGSAQAEGSGGILLDTATLRVKDGPLSLLGTSRLRAPGLDIRSSTIRATGAGRLSFEGVAAGNQIAIGIDLPVRSESTSIAAGPGAIAFTGDRMFFRPPARVEGQGPVLIQPRTPSRPIELGTDGSAGALGFAADLPNVLAPGFSQITIGRPDGTGRITTASPLTFTSDVLIRSPGSGSAGVALSHSIDAGAHNLTIVSAGPVALNAGTLSVAGKTLRIKGSTINAFAATLSAGDGGRIVFEGNTTLRPATTIAVVVSPAQTTNPALIDVVGRINLNNATLRATGPGRIAAGTGFSLIRNDGSDAISGKFAQGSSLTIAGQPYQLTLNRGGNDAVLKRQAPPITVKLVTRLVQNGRKKVRTTFIDANFVEGGKLKTEILSPLQPPRFKNIRITTSDADRDGTIDTVTVLGNVGKKVTTMIVSIP